ncbi:MAG: DNA topoisomerase VI subunit B [Deltaproteobacteria bacterium]|nr:DNA topoisomerase VI subunit B [Deltaproteobacteria bacterium]
MTSETTEPTDNTRRRATAESMAAKQRDISVSEFFTKNRHLLGFDNPAKALLTSVKEAVDNSLDACEEAGILPSLKVQIEEVSEGRYRVTVEDNGPGIVKAQIPKIFAKLLYGSKFHRLKQSRGQQGIGISAAGMYGQLTTGRPIVIISRTGKRAKAVQMSVRIDARTNAPDVLEEREIDWAPEHGTSVAIEMEGSYRGGRASVASYLEQTVVANPHLELTFVPPKGDSVHFPRASDQLPTETVEIKPHPYGVELGMLIKSFQESGERSAREVLMQDYSRVTSPVATELLRKSGVDPAARASRLDGPEIESIHRVIQLSQASLPPLNRLLKTLAKRDDKFSNAILDVGKNFTPALVDVLARRAGFEATELAKKVELTQLERFSNSLEKMQVRILPPPATCVAPIGEALIIEGLKRRFKGDFYASHTRPPAVYRGNPFVVEVGIAYGGELAKDTSAEVLRFANRVPLLYQPRACATTEATVRVNWKSYAKDNGLNQRGAELPVGPLAIFVHLASVWVPFTNEAKEAIASYDEIIEEIRTGLMECGRKLASYLNAHVADRLQRERRSIFERYIEELSVAIGEITKLGTDRVRTDFLGAMNNFVHLDVPKLPPPSTPPPADDGGFAIGEDGEGFVATESNDSDETDETDAQAAPGLQEHVEEVAAKKPAKAAVTAAQSARKSVRPPRDSVAPEAAPKQPAKSAPREPLASKGEWPPRPVPSSAAEVPAAPIASPVAAPTSAPVSPPVGPPVSEGPSWLEKELAARIAAKKQAAAPALEVAGKVVPSSLASAVRASGQGPTMAAAQPHRGAMPTAKRGAEKRRDDTTASVTKTTIAGTKKSGAKKSAR